MYGMVILMVCTGISLKGSKPYARTSVFLAGVLLASTITIFISFLFKSPFDIPEKHINYTAFRFHTLRDNFLPRFIVAPVAGKEDGSSETIQSVFSVLFPACNGILAGAQLSGDLRDPSKSIPKGTLYAVGLTFVTYSLIVILMGGTISRESMYNDLNILQDVSFPFFFRNVLSIRKAKREEISVDSVVTIRYDLYVDVGFSLSASLRGGVVGSFDLCCARSGDWIGQDLASYC
ncbi:amino acid permease-domain-containing protein [Endogone sp. FLAS-F59071]|nr:amino acid permease-domain-containing protein [Endogone sp. FLAS-F59071]|eukprot:RUS15575.1 amino acid permease-domain-containing protein [Endogone sp. FLAS-F59071]